MRLCHPARAGSWKYSPRTSRINRAVAEHGRGGSVEVGETAALDAVPARAEAHQVFSEELTAVILPLQVGLRRALRSQKIWTSAKAIDLNADRIVGKWKVRPDRGVRDLV